MTTPFERTNAVDRAEDFLLRLLDPKQTPHIPMVIRREARSILRHYPSKFYIKLAAKKSPDIFDEWPK